MNNTKNEGYNNAGLFCSLKDAIVDNLVIDSSCSFTGYNAGALSVSVDGSLTVKHTTNSAAVSGRFSVGGFIGLVQGMEQPTVVSFDGCVNHGNVTASGNDVGGFVWVICNNANIVMTFFNSINNGNVTGGYSVGGLVGCIYSTSD